MMDLTTTTIMNMNIEEKEKINQKNQIFNDVLESPSSFLLLVVFSPSKSSRMCRMITNQP